MRMSNAGNLACGSFKRAGFWACIWFAVLAPAVGGDRVYFDEADRLFREAQYARAGEAFQRLCEENPYNGYFFYRMAMCHYHQKDYDRAIEGLKKAIGLGRWVPASAYNIACCYALQGKADEALVWLDKAAEAGFSGIEGRVADDSDFNRIRQSDAYRARFRPEAKQSESRDEGWRRDLEFLTRRMEQTHVDLYRKVSRDAWREAVDALAAKIPDLEDHQVIVEIMRLTALVGDGHTLVFPPRHGQRALHRLPLRFYLFREGLYVTSADAEYADLVGKRVVSVGGVSPQEALKRIEAITSTDNPMGHKWIGPGYLAVSEILHALDIAKDVGGVEIAVVNDDGRETRRFIKASPADPSFRSKWVLPNGWRDAQPSGDARPIYLQKTDETFWRRHLPERNLVYCQINQMLNKPDQTVAAFTEELFAFIEEKGATGLILDIRHNSGGNNFLNWPLIYGIIRNDQINQTGKLFTITGRNTFSAAVNLTNRLDAHTRTLFVGEPPSSRPNFVGETNQIRLPYSGLTVTASSRTWQDSLSDDARLWVAPHLVAEPTMAAYREGRDPALEAIFAYLDRGQSTEEAP